MKRIGIYAGKNLLRIILLLFAVSILTFALVSASPIDPLQANVGQAALGSMSEKQKEKTPFKTPSTIRRKIPVLFGCFAKFFTPCLPLISPQQKNIPL